MAMYVNKELVNSIIGALEGSIDRMAQKIVSTINDANVIEQLEKEKKRYQREKEEWFRKGCMYRDFPFYHPTSYRSGTSCHVSELWKNLKNLYVLTFHMNKKQWQIPLVHLKSDKMSSH